MTKADLLSALAHLPDNAEIRLTGTWGEEPIKAAIRDSSHTLWLHSCGVEAYLAEAGMTTADPEILFLDLIPPPPKPDVTAIALAIAKTQY